LETPDLVSISGYTAALNAYLASPSSAGGGISLLGRTLVRMGLGPAEIVSLHTEVVGAVGQELSEQEQLRLFSLAHHFLLEVMLAYGDQYRAYSTQRAADATSATNALLQDEQQHSQALVQLGLDKDEAITTVAHELRAPLTAAKAMAELCQMVVAQGQIEQLPELLTRLSAAIETLVHLTGELTEVTRNEAIALELGQVDIRAAVLQACSWVLPAANDKGIRVIPPEDRALLVHGNAEALVSIVSNLLSNAVRYSPPQTTVIVRLAAVESMAVVEVQDTGIGMSEEVLSHIFERFYRAPDAKREVPRGLGVGLAIVKQLAEAQGAEITAESVLGQGSTFRVSLPVSSSGAQS
jgi:signal transduction histidine kinase